MAKDHWGYGSLAAGLALLCLCVIGNASFTERAKAQSARVGLERVSIGALASAAETYGFTKDDIQKLPKALGQTPYAYSGAMRLSASAQERTEAVEAIGVGGEFFAFHQANMADGTVFPADAVEERVAVLDSELAWRLFRAQKVSGMTFTLSDKEFAVAGVLERDESVLGSLVDIGVPRLYLPMSTLIALEKEARVSNLEIHFDDVIAGEGKTRAETFLQELGKGASDFRITDGYEQARIMPQWGHMLVFVLWVALTVRLLRWFSRRAYVAWRELRASSERQGMRLALKRKRSQLLAEALLGLGLAGLAAGLFFLARFSFYIPGSQLPGELFDVSHYVGLFAQAVRARVFDANYTPMWWSAYTDLASDISRWLFAFGVLGWILFLLGNALLRRNGDAWSKKAFWALGLWVLAMAFSCGLLALCAVAPVLDTRVQLALFACTALFLVFAPPWETVAKPEETGIAEVSQ